MGNKVKTIINEITDILEFIQNDPNISCIDELVEELEDLRYEPKTAYRTQITV